MCSDLINDVQLADLIFMRFDSLTGLWTVYLTLYIGIIGAISAFPEIVRKMSWPIAICVFWLFALSNLYSICSVQQSILYLEQLIGVGPDNPQKFLEDASIADSVKPYGFVFHHRVIRIIVFHLLLNLFMTYILYRANSQNK